MFVFIENIWYSVTIRIDSLRTTPNNSYRNEYRCYLALEQVSRIGKMAFDQTLRDGKRRRHFLQRPLFLSAAMLSSNIFCCRCSPNVGGQTDDATSGRTGFSTVSSAARVPWRSRSWEAKLASLKLKARPEHLIGYLPLDIELTAQTQRKQS